MKLNIGCGINKKEGFVNVDKNPQVNPDKVADLEKSLPFKDNTFNHIHCDQVLEHVDDIVTAMSEIHRVAKPGAKVFIGVPYYKSKEAFTNPTHRRFFTEDTFSSWEARGNYNDQLEVGGDKHQFNVVKVKKLRGSINPFHVHGLVFYLEVVK